MQLTKDELLRIYCAMMTAVDYASHTGTIPTKQFQDLMEKIRAELTK